MTSSKTFQKTCPHTEQRLLGHQFRDVAASLAMGRKVAHACLTTGTVKQAVWECNRCQKMFLRVARS